MATDSLDWHASRERKTPQMKIPLGELAGDCKSIGKRGRSILTICFDIFTIMGHRLHNINRT